MKRKAKITEEDFSAWRDNLITQSVFAYLDDRIEFAKKVWISHLTANGVTPEQLHALKIEIQAKVELMEDMKTLELGDIQEDDADQGKVVALARR